jgi:hypothetical protein
MNGAASSRTVLASPDQKKTASKALALFSSSRNQKSQRAEKLLTQILFATYGHKKPKPIASA